MNNIISYIYWKKLSRDIPTTMFQGLNNQAAWEFIHKYKIKNGSH